MKYKISEAAIYHRRQSLLKKTTIRSDYLISFEIKELMNSSVAAHGSSIGNAYLRKVRS